MPFPEGVYGLLAEFDLRHVADRGCRGLLQRRLAPPGLLHAVSMRRGGRGDRFPSQLRPAAHSGRWIDGLRRDVPDGDLDQCLGVSAEHCRAAVLFLACVRGAGIRVDDSVGRPDSRLWHARHVRLASSYHPLFNAPNFRTGATSDKFFLCLEARDPKFSLVESRAFLEAMHPVSIVEVEY